MALKKSPVGIDIGHANIRIAQAERTAVGFQIMKYAVTETPKGAIRDGQIVEPEEVGLAIKRAMKEAHIFASLPLWLLREVQYLFEQCSSPKLQIR